MDYSKLTSMQVMDEDGRYWYIEKVHVPEEGASWVQLGAGLGSTRDQRNDHMQLTLDELRTKYRPDPAEQDGASFWK